MDATAVDLPHCGEIFLVSGGPRDVEAPRGIMAGKLTYQQAGVDTRKAAALVGDIGTHVRRTQQNRKLWGAFGLFAACYDLSAYQEPVIMTGCDGVGTKLELLLEHDLLETAGKDLVAMSVNDILTTGGDPLLFPGVAQAGLHGFVGETQAPDEVELGAARGGV